MVVPKARETSSILRARLMSSTPPQLPISCLSAELVEAQLSVTQCSSVLDLTDQELLEQVKGCEAVVSCLSHVGNPWAKPHDLCLSISKRICSAMQQAAQAETTGTRPKYLMMGTVLVPKADGSEKAHGWASTFMVGLLNTLLPPMYDHKLTAAYLNENMPLDARAKGQDS